MGEVKFNENQGKAKSKNIQIHSQGFPLVQKQSNSQRIVRRLDWSQTPAAFHKINFGITLV